MELLNLKKISCLVSLVIFVVNILKSTNGANIIGVFTSHSPSHFIVQMSVMKSLAEAGHNLTIVSSLQPKITHPTIKHIIIAPTEEQEKQLQSNMGKVATQKQSIVSTMGHLLFSMNTMFSLQRDLLKDERFTKLYNEKFDLVILGYFLNEYQLGIGAKFRAPIVVVWSGPPSGFTNDMIGNPAEIAYVPSFEVALKAGEGMDFLQRFKNFISSGFITIFKKLMLFKTNKYYDELFVDGPNFPTIDDMKKNVSLLFCNSHFSEGPIRPNVPAIIEIGGIQIKDKPDALPKDIAEFLNAADKEGAILFCLGSNLKASNIKPEIIRVIFRTLSSLKQKVIFKWDDMNNLPGKSTNILFKKWLPQDDILAHPSMKLFITHAGKGGVAEAQYHSVPMLALPVFGDQPGNAEKIVLSGYGLQLDLFEMTESSFKNAISEILSNPVYKENIQTFSNLYRDRPLTARQSVVYWTEYVLRHHGARHMQSPLVHLNLFQSLSLDVIGVLILIAYIALKIVKITFKFIAKKLCSKNKKSAYKKMKSQ